MTAHGTERKSQFSPRMSGVAGEAEVIVEAGDFADWPNAVIVNFRT